MKNKTITNIAIGQIWLTNTKELVKITDYIPEGDADPAPFFARVLEWEGLRPTTNENLWLTLEGREHNGDRRLKSLILNLRKK